jgi:hypothetical protein
MDADRPKDLRFMYWGADGRIRVSGMYIIHDELFDEKTFFSHVFLTAEICTTAKWAVTDAIASRQRRPLPPPDPLLPYQTHRRPLKAHGS